MRHVTSGGLAAAALGTVLIVAGAVPASAQVARSHLAVAASDLNGDLLTLVRERGGGGGGGGRAGRGGGSGNDRGGERGDRGGSVDIPDRSGAGNDRSRGDAGHSRDDNRAAGEHRDRKKHRKHRREHDSGGFDDSDRVGDAWAYCVKRNRSGQVLGGTYVSPDGKPRFCR